MVAGIPKKNSILVRQFFFSPTPMDEGCESTQATFSKHNSMYCFDIPIMDHSRSTRAHQTKPLPFPLVNNANFLFFSRTNVLYYVKGPLFLCWN